LPDLAFAALLFLRVLPAVRFGKYTPMRSKDKRVQILINGELSMSPKQQAEAMDSTSAPAAAARCNSAMAVIAALPVWRNCEQATCGTMQSSMMHLTSISNSTWLQLQ
jgi:hypothetical protein